MTTSRDIFADEYNTLVGETGDHHHATSINPIVFSFLGDVAGKKVLDLACGQGYFSRILAQKGAQVWGCDLSSRLISFAQKKEQQEELGIQYAVCSADTLPYPTAMFDMIVCNMSVHDMEHIDTVFHACAKVLLPGGIFVFSTIHPIKTLNMTKKTNHTLQDENGYMLALRSYMIPKQEQRPQFGNTRLFHRPLETYFSTLFGAGFCITGFKEVSAIAQDDTAPEKIAYKKEIPSFIVVKAMRQ